MVDELLLLGPLEWNVRLLVGIVCLALLYSFSLIRYTAIKIYHKQAVLFFIGLGLLYVTIGSPLSTISHFSFSLHMIQMSILYFIIPPVFLLGIPSDMFNKMVHILKTKMTSKLNLSPKLMLYVFAALFLMYHLPFVLNILSQNTFMQNGYLLSLFILSFGMWWPIVSPDPDQRLCKRCMKRYAFLSGLILMPACMLFILTAFIDGANNPFLTQLTAHLCIPSESTSFHILPPPFNTKIDQFMSGIFMLGLHKFGLVMTFKLSS